MGGGKLIASVKDTDGNVIGLIQSPQWCVYLLTLQRRANRLKPSNAAHPSATRFLPFDKLTNRVSKGPAGAGASRSMRLQ